MGRGHHSPHDLGLTGWIFFRHKLSRKHVVYIFLYLGVVHILRYHQRGGRGFANDYTTCYCIKYNYCKSDNGGGGGFETGQKLIT